MLKISKLLENIKRLWAHLTGASRSQKYFRESFSQCGEDLIVDFIFSQIGIIKPTYLDIGAHHPYYLSNSAFFHEKGCRGINVEPDSELFKLFIAHRKDDTNLNCGVGGESGNLVLYIMDVPALNTFSESEAHRLVAEHGFKIANTITTPIQTISNIVQHYNNGIFPDFLSIDVEGLDTEIIKSIDFKKSAPTVICLETISYSANGNGQKDDELINYLTNCGYMVYADTNINTIFVLQNKWQR